MIFCFSGTGNSRYVAQVLACHWNDRVEMIGPVLTDSHPVFTLQPEEKVVWVFPVYSWGVPPVVVEFMRKVTLDVVNGCHHYMACTCGDDVGLAHRQWRRIVRGRGWSLRGTFSVQMPNTYTLMKGFDVDSPDVVKDKLAVLPSRLDEVIGSIGRGFGGDDVVTGSWAWVKSRRVYPYFVRFCMSPRPFHATGDCIGCGKCVRECPFSNVTMDSCSHPRWGSRCALCLRCYHICPQGAVQYGKSTAGKGQYICPLEK